MAQILPSVIISGTNTDVGKSIVTGLLCAYLHNDGHDIISQKWIQSGTAHWQGNHGSDIDIHDHWYTNPHADNPNRCPVTLTTPASPHLSAKIDQKEIDPATIKNAFHTLQRDHDTVIVEGSGGLLVPITKQLTLIDLIQDLKLPNILVVANQLGCINHALLSIEALQRRNCPIVGIVMTNPTTSTPEMIAKDNPRIIEDISGVKVLGELPHIRLDDVKNGRNAFVKIGEAISQALGEI